MKIKSILMTGIVGVLFFFLFPLIFIKLNQTLYLLKLNSLFLKIIGVLLIFISGVVFIICWLTFNKLGKGTPVPIEPPKKLVIKGLYKYSRNPIYIAYLLSFLGIFFTFGESFLLIYFLLATLFIHLFVVYYEEPILKMRFGKDYIEYTKKVPRWII